MSSATSQSRHARFCVDERLDIGWSGQSRTTLGQMQAAGYRNRIEQVEPDLWGIGTNATFAMGQRSLLVRTERGNVLWDPMSYLDDETADRVWALGGIGAISASHPHCYGVVVEWSHAFGGAPIHLPAADREWVQRADDAYCLTTIT